MTPPELHHRMNSRLDELGALARAMAAWCALQSLPADEVARLNLMVDELVTNTVLHGYGGRPEGWIELRLRREGDIVHLQLSDGAAHFDPTRHHPVTPAENLDELVQRRPGGLGLGLVRRLALRWQHTALPQGNQLSIWRQVGAPPARP
jgi:anti-sigma regulatory factor (Ser/Thr protein kinase)